MLLIWGVLSLINLCLDLYKSLNESHHINLYNFKNFLYKKYRTRDSHVDLSLDLKFKMATLVYYVECSGDYTDLYQVSNSGKWASCVHKQVHVYPLCFYFFLVTSHTTLGSIIINNRPHYQWDVYNIVPSQ